MLNKKKILNQVIYKENIRRISNEECKNLKNVLLEMTADIDRVCKKNNLHIFLVGGSLLGAVRHGGFIPWDDDMDLGMMRRDYQRLIEIFEDELGEGYMLRCPNSLYPNGNRFMQIYKKNTVLDTGFGSNPLQPKAVSIDIFPYDYAPNNYLVRLIKGIYCNGLMFIASSVMDYTYRDESYRDTICSSVSGKMLYFIQNLTGKLFSWKSPQGWFNKVDKKIRWNRKTNYLTSATGRKHYLGEIFPKDIFLPLKKIKFESLTLFVPSHADVYLRKLYGDTYMNIPTEDKRESHFIQRIEL